MYGFVIFQRKSRPLVRSFSIVFQYYEYMESSVRYDNSILTIMTHAVGLVIREIPLGTISGRHCD